MELGKPNKCIIALLAIGNIYIATSMTSDYFSTLNFWNSQLVVDLIIRVTGRYRLEKQ